MATRIGDLAIYVSANTVGLASDLSRAASMVGNFAGGVHRRMSALVTPMASFARDVGAMAGGNLLASGIKQAAGGMSGLVESSLKLAGAAEVSKMKFGVMLGGAEKAGELLEDLRKFAATSPVAFGEAQTHATSLLSAKVEQDQVVPTLGKLSDMAAGDPEALKSWVRVYGQIKGLGKLQGDDWRQIANTGAQRRRHGQGARRRRGHVPAAAGARPGDVPGLAEGHHQRDDWDGPVRRHGRGVRGDLRRQDRQAGRLVGRPQAVRRAGRYRRDVAQDRGRRRGHVRRFAQAVRGPAAAGDQVGGRTRPRAGADGGRGRQGVPRHRRHPDEQAGPGVPADGPVDQGDGGRDEGVQADAGRHRRIRGVAGGRHHRGAEGGQAALGQLYQRFRRSAPGRAHADPQRAEGDRPQLLVRQGDGQGGPSGILDTLTTPARVAVDRKIDAGMSAVIREMDALQQRYNLSDQDAGKLYADQGDLRSLVVEEAKARQNAKLNGSPLRSMAEAEAAMDEVNRLAALRRKRELDINELTGGLTGGGLYPEAKAIRLRNEAEAQRQYDELMDSIWESAYPKDLKIDKLDLAPRLAELVNTLNTKMIDPAKKFAADLADLSTLKDVGRIDGDTFALALSDLAKEAGGHLGGPPQLATGVELGSQQLASMVAQAGVGGGPTSVEGLLKALADLAAQQLVAAKQIVGNTGQKPVVVTAPE